MINLNGIENKYIAISDSASLGDFEAISTIQRLARTGNLTGDVEEIALAYLAKMVDLKLIVI